MSNGKILFVVAHKGFQQIEYAVPKKILIDAGFIIVTASDQRGVALAKDGVTTVSVDLLISEVVVKEYGGIFLIGGPGALEFLDTHATHDMLNTAQQLALIIGAICVSTRILAHAGVLRGKQATGWDGDDALEGIYAKHGVLYRQNQPVVVDENIITASGPEAAAEFAEQIIMVMQNNKGWG